MFQIIVVAAMPLPLADKGQQERVVEVYAMASRYPLVANSRLMEYLAGRHITAVAAQVPADAAAAAQDRGRTRHLELAIAGLQSELGD